MWTRNLTELLISKYKQHEHLYDKKHPDYADKLQRSITLHNIYLDLEEKCPNITLQAIKAKLHTLRCQYLKELRQVFRSKKNGETYEPRLWCFKQLNFLRPYCIPKGSSSNTCDNIENTEDSTYTLFSDEDENKCEFLSNENDENTEVMMESSFMDSHEYKSEFLRTQSTLSYRWTRDVVELLIKKFKAYDLLYNFKNRDYLNKNKRTEALFKICKDLRVKNPDITVESIKTKMHTLRSQYAKELREISNRKRKGVNTNDSYEPKLWCFNELTFLKPYCNNSRRQSISKNNKSIKDSAKTEISSDENSSNGNENENQFSSDFVDMELLTENAESDRAPTPKSAISQETSSAKKKRRNEIDIEEDEATSSDKKDKYSIFGEYVASELRSLDISPDLQFKLKNSIQQLIIDITSEQAFRLYGAIDEHAEQVTQQESLT